jgi:hypothetical protein
VVSAEVIGEVLQCGLALLVGARHQQPTGLSGEPRVIVRKLSLRQRSRCRDR